MDEAPKKKGVNWDQAVEDTLSHLDREDSETVPRIKSAFVDSIEVTRARLQKKAEGHDIPDSDEDEDDEMYEDDDEMGTEVLQLGSKRPPVARHVSFVGPTGSKVADPRARHVSFAHTKAMTKEEREKALGLAPLKPADAAQGGEKKSAEAP